MSHIKQRCYNVFTLYNGREAVIIFVHGGRNAHLKTIVDIDIDNIFKMNIPKLSCGDIVILSVIRIAEYIKAGPDYRFVWRVFSCYRKYVLPTASR